MIDKPIQCTVVTPEKQVYDSRVDAVTIPAHDGEMGILFNRAPLVCKLGTGVLRIRRGIGEKRLFVDRGFAHVLDNSVVVLTEQALRPEQIDRQQAEELLNQAREMKVIDEDSARKRDHAEAVARTQLRMISS
jgi:F-type H+-transporting ATPase subunit epsilon